MPANATTIIDLAMDEGPYEIGQTVELTGQVFLDCQDHSDGDVVTLTLLNPDTHPWAVAALTNLTFAVANCQPAGQSLADTVGGDADGFGVYDVQQTAVSFS